jgi:hypothetical protein
MFAVAAAVAPLAAAMILPGRITLPRLAATVRQRELLAAAAILAPPPALRPLAETVGGAAIVHTGGTAAVVGDGPAKAPLAAAGMGAAAVAFAGAAAEVGRQWEFRAAAAVSPHLAH